MNIFYVREERIKTRHERKGGKYINFENSLSKYMVNRSIEGFLIDHQNIKVLIEGE